ncbi:hypothetical protein OHT57_05390 [Streptomyces sp. NBC_00285]|uniref:hypothetical protein n=1 Tax=Streptomyces sp. NBC_00285 TaxID=2975700 RepID=UPI002E2C9CEE|nr:hypothetical protein [Streptomyces sp. NBC_00285]
MASGEPERLTDGSAQGVRYQLTRFARLVRTEPPEPAGQRLLAHRRIIRLVSLAKKAERVFGGPLDMEFGFDVDGKRGSLRRGRSSRRPRDPRAGSRAPDRTGPLPRCPATARRGPLTEGAARRGSP